MNVTQKAVTLASLHLSFSPKNNTKALTNGSPPGNGLASNCFTLLWYFNSQFEYTLFSKTPTYFGIVTSAKTPQSLASFIFNEFLCLYALLAIFKNHITLLLCFKKIIVFNIFLPESCSLDCVQ